MEKYKVGIQKVRLIYKNKNLKLLPTTNLAVRSFAFGGASAEALESMAPRSNLGVELGFDVVSPIF